MGEELIKSHNTRSEKFGNTEVSISPAVCPLCLSEKALEQDHDHETDLCRGQICHACNVLLGRFDRPVAEIQRFLDYLRFWSEQHATQGGQSYTEYMRATYSKFGKLGRPRRKPAA